MEGGFGFVLQVNGPMAGEACKWGGRGGWGAYNRICFQVNRLTAGAAYKRGVGRSLIRGSLQYWDSFQQLIKMIVIHRMIMFLGNK